MDKKIIAIMVTLVVVAALVVAFVMIAAGGVRSSGGFTKLFDQLEYNGDETFHQELEMPADWDAGDVKTASDRIVDMAYNIDESHYTTDVYVTTLWFQYIGEKWLDTSRGTSFYVPVADGTLLVNHGLFSITVSSATNISAHYDVGDTITIEAQVVSVDGALAFNNWIVADTL
jgi:hypothetical protein